MTHSNTKEIKCPNCGHMSTDNYCSRCGQATHLHNDSFVGLISHFISHYFHFESKFWSTLKTLVIRPGALDIAYFNKQRTRYTQPISLYIFVSIVFFIVAAYTFRFKQTTERNKDGSLSMSHSWSLGFHNRIPDAKEHEKWIVDYNCDSLREIKADLKEAEEERKSFFKKPGNRFRFTKIYFFTTFYNYFVLPFGYRHQLYDMDTSITHIYNEFFHLLPKIFFMLMPLLALMVYVTFRLRQYYFANYAVFSLHAHIFMFLSVLVLLLVVGTLTDASRGIWMELFIIGIPLLHFIVSCRNFFGRSWAYTVTVGALTFATYICAVVIVSALILLLVINNS